MKTLELLARQAGDRTADFMGCDGDRILVPSLAPWGRSLDPTPQPFYTLEKADRAGVIENATAAILAELVAQGVTL